MAGLPAYLSVRGRGEELSSHLNRAWVKLLWGSREAIARAEYIMGKNETLWNPLVDRGKWSGIGIRCH